MRISTRLEGGFTANMTTDPDFVHGFFRTILKEIPDAVFLTRDDGTFVYICPNVSNIFGYSSDDVFAMESIHNFLPLSEAELSSVDGNINNLVKTPCSANNKFGNFLNLEITISSVDIGEGIMGSISATVNCFNMASLICVNCKQVNLVSNVLERITSCFNCETSGKRRSSTTTATLSFLVRRQSLTSLVPRRLGTFTLT